MRSLGIEATARASFYIYNTEDDVEAFVDGVKTSDQDFQKVSQPDLRNVRH